MAEDVLSPDQFNETLFTISWSRRTLAERLGLTSGRMVRLWAARKVPVPPAVAHWLQQVAQALDGLPLPQQWS